jgi:transmembrane protein TMEM260 (protein O-mannosyltransferase)
VDNPPSRLRRFGEAGPASRADERVGVVGLIIPACLVATLAFWAYTQTLLPGVDLGDTGGFQAAVLWPEVSARQAYPLYYDLARPFVRMASPGNPARALNLFSAIWAAVAVGLVVLICSSITGSGIAGAVAGLLLGFSYTFWSQAVIAEVYSLHLALIAACMVALGVYAARPSRARLVLFFGIYAVAFGNHLGMILLLVPFALFLVRVHPRPRELCRPAVITTAALIAAAGALQYAPNFLAVWQSLEAPSAWSDRLGAFWFDVTKQDWRATSMMGIRPEQAADRLAMWWFDARQQFGLLGWLLAVLGVPWLWRLRGWAALILTGYAITTGFALTYNVGDSHVFFLPAHFFAAVSAGAGVAFLLRAIRREPPGGAPGRGVKPRFTSWDIRKLAAITVGGLALGYAGWRGWSTWPAVDRHNDRRGEELIAQLTRGVDEQGALLVTEMNWQLENVLLYADRHLRTDLAWVRLDEVLTHWPFFVDDNQRIGRDVVLNGEAAATVVAGYGPAFPVVQEPPGGPPLPEALAQVPPGAPYVLTILTPLGERPLDQDAVDTALAGLTTGQARRSRAAYELFAGSAGAPPRIHRASDRPFTEQFRLEDQDLLVRMDSWLPSDTFLRAGFGHVVRGRDHVLIIERGLSFVWLRPDGRPSQPYYAGSLFAPESRYRIPAATVRLADTSPMWSDRGAPRAASAAEP